MAKDAQINVRVDSSVKTEVDQILQELGISASEAINMFYNLIRLYKGLPFDVKIPNQETIASMEKSERGEGLTRYKSIQEAMEDAKNW